jgi:hypothetical protein
MESLEARRIVRDLVAGNFVPTGHAEKRMAERNVSEADIQSVGHTCSSIEPQRDGKFKINGRDMDGEDLSVVCAYDGQTLIITLF